MFKRNQDEQLYFSTKVELKINDSIYRPSICYRVPALAKTSLEKYAADGKITFYAAPVRFVNGAIAHVKTEQASAGVPSVVRVVDENKPVKRKYK